MTAEQVVAAVERHYRASRDKADAALKAGNNLGFDGYIERAIALEDLLMEILPSMLAFAFRAR